MRPNHVEHQRGVSDPRTLKEQLVRSDRAHAALVFDGDGTVELFEDLGFTRVRQVGKHAWVVSPTVRSRAKSTSRS